MTLLVFLGIFLSLLILRLLPGLLMKLVLALPQLPPLQAMRRLAGRKLHIAIARGTRAQEGPRQLFLLPEMNPPSANPQRVRLVLVSSSLVALGLLVTTAFWGWNSGSF